jgi:DNA-binding response OmpR family regulator
MILDRGVILRHRLATALYLANRLTIDRATKSVWIADLPLHLTHLEYVIVEYLEKNINHIVSRDTISDVVYGCNKMRSRRVVDVHICNIRKKMKAQCGHSAIETFYSGGYAITTVPRYMFLRANPGADIGVQEAVSQP